MRLGFFEIVGICHRDNQLIHEIRLESVDPTRPIVSISCVY